MVWDYTQNYAHRTEWDNSVLSAEEIQTFPNRMLRLQMKGNTAMTFVYKLDDRPNKTSLKAIDIQSRYISSAGGSWTYEEQNGITNWTRTDTIIFNDLRFFIVYRFIMKWLIAMQIKASMRNVKSILEQQ